MMYSIDQSNIDFSKTFFLPFFFTNEALSMCIQSHLYVEHIFIYRIRITEIILISFAEPIALL